MGFTDIGIAFKARPFTALILVLALMAGMAYTTIGKGAPAGPEERILS